MTSKADRLPYDRHVPMIFLGAEIAPGGNATRAATVDFALARVLGARMPNDLDGRVLRGVVVHR